MLPHTCTQIMPLNTALGPADAMAASTVSTMATHCVPIGGSHAPMAVPPTAVGMKATRSLIPIPMRDLRGAGGGGGERGGAG